MSVGRVGQMGVEEAGPGIIKPVCVCEIRLGLVFGTDSTVQAPMYFLCRQEMVITAAGLEQTATVAPERHQI